jgi:acid stress chaperone HdeB
MSNVKILSAVLIAVAIACASPAQAQKVDLSTITCKQFLEMNQESISLILMWMAGYYSDEDAPPIVDFDKMKEDAQKLGAYCKEHPDAGLITAADETIGN